MKRGRDVTGTRRGQQLEKEQLAEGKRSGGKVREREGSCGEIECRGGSTMILHVRHEDLVLDSPSDDSL